MVIIGESKPKQLRAMPASLKPIPFNPAHSRLWQFAKVERAHTHGLVSALLMPLISGGSVAVIEELAADAVLQWLAAQPISLITLPPVMHRALLEQQRLTPSAPLHRLRFLRS
jgi:acyl-coenzyme A synthetase/AMP-(fatty) acid ligase